MSDLFGDDYEGRKGQPVFEGFVMYFPKAIAAVAAVSEAGNRQHNPGQPLHWARGKSMDQFNTALRHMMDHRMGGGRVPEGQEGQEENNGWIPEHMDKDGVWHLAKAAWRIMAALQLAIEEDEKKGHAVEPATISGERWEIVSWKDITNVHFEDSPDCQCTKWCVGEGDYRWVEGGRMHTPSGCNGIVPVLDPRVPNDVNINEGYWIRKVATKSLGYIDDPGDGLEI